MNSIHRQFVILVLLTLILAGGSIPVRAHANLAQSQPPANAALDIAPPEIRLWFTEPLEPQFSRITLRDSSGSRVDLPPAQVDADDPMQLFVPLGELAHGIYTITWRVVSAADGHTTEGSIPFAVGTAAAPAGQSILSESLPAESAGIRWFNLLSMSLLIGAVGFWVLAWRPQASDEQYPFVTKTLRRLMFIGWLLTGLAGGWLLLHHTASIAEISLFAAAGDPALAAVLSQTRFGSLWLLRMVCWLGIGGLLISRADRESLYLCVLALCGVMLLSQSLYSHASAAQDAFAAVAGDWLHLAATGLWVGGLAAFAVVIPQVRHTEAIARLVATFSNYVRVCVAALIISGGYAAWLHVGSIEALLTTLYGRALLVKLVLFAPLLALAGVNLIFTTRGLRKGQRVWVGRLRQFVAAEAALSIAILAAVGVMTATNPAREVLAVRSAASSPTVEAEPFFEMQTTSDVMVHLEFTPGYAGENTFIITLFNMADGSPIDDASLIRLRFDNQAGGYAQSELRPQPQGSGVYMIAGANLSAPGTWRMRMTIQRPGAFDTVLDFMPTVAPAPQAAAQVLDTTIPATVRLIAVSLMGLAFIAGGAFFLVSVQPRFRSRSALVSVLLVGVGAIFLLSAASTLA